MFIDYVSLLLLNMAAGFFLLACYVYKGIETADKKGWAPAFSMVGVIALLNGLHMIWTWPLPSSFNVAFGEMSALLGIIFLGAALALGCGLSLTPVAIYASFAGLASIVLGMRIINLRMTQEPFVSGAGFILSGMAGIFAAPVLYLSRHKALRVFCAIVLSVIAVIWARTCYTAYWAHLSGMSKWVPATMR